MPNMPPPLCGWPTIKEADTPLYRHALCAGRIEGAIWATVALLVLATAAAFGAWL